MLILSSQMLKMKRSCKKKRRLPEQPPQGVSDML